MPEPAFCDDGRRIPGSSLLPRRVYRPDTRYGSSKILAELILIAVKEAPLLMPVQRVVGGVEVENDLLGRLPVRFQE